MRPDLRRVLGFALCFIPIFLILLAVYLKAIPWYRVAPERAANLVMRQLRPPTQLQSLPGGGWRARAGVDARQAFASWQPFVVHLLFLNLALLPALVLATPVPIRDRLQLLGWAIPLLLIVQTLSLIGLVRGQLCLFDAPGSFLCLWLLRLVYASGQLSAAALWAALTWSYWLPREVPPRGRQSS